MQSRKQSVLETIVRAFFNYATALGIQRVIFPHLSISQNLGIGAIFMANSIVGGYFIRRLFNARTKRTITPAARGKLAIERLRKL